MPPNLVCPGYRVKIPLHHQSQTKTQKQYGKCNRLRLTQTNRETEILNLIAKGRTTREIADELWLSVNTVESHRKRMIKRVNAKNIFGVFNYTITNGILNPMVFTEPCLM